MSSIIQPILDFLSVKTPVTWLQAVKDHIPLLLIDHAHCERKAATTALNFMSKYAKEYELITCMSALAREELLHFEKVLALLKARQIPFGPLRLSNYAKKLHLSVTRADYLRHLSDSLIVGAIIEARSCERFHALLPYIEDSALEKFYASLVKSESRHFEDYLHFAQYYRPEPIAPRVQEFLAIERTLIESPDPLFRLHSGSFE